MSFQLHHPRRVFVRLVLGLVTVAATLVPLVASAAPATTSKASGSLPCNLPTPFRRNEFDRSTRINNQWLPLPPGAQFTLEGRANRTGKPLPHTVILTVTDLVKVIDGVRTVVLWDRDIQEGGLAEAELAFHAQDDARNVWGLGEYPEEYENGAFTGAPNTWITGQVGAQGGIAMLAHPRRGTPIFLQGVAPSIDFLDCAQVFARNQHICVPVKCYDQVLITDETSPLAGTGHQRKYYAPGVGNVQITAVDDPEGETLVLTSVKRLDPAGLTAARNAALQLDRHAYQVSAVYRHTPPAARCEMPTALLALPAFAGRFDDGPGCDDR